MKIFTYLGDFGLIWILIGFLFILSGSQWGRAFFRKTFHIDTGRYLYYGILLLIVLVTSFLFTEFFLKELIKRPRPFISHSLNLIITPPTGYSMPSGHSTTAFASSFIIFKTNKGFGIIAFILAFLIAFSRLYLMVHYPTDVLLGIFVGIAFSAINYLIVKKFFINLNCN